MDQALVELLHRSSVFVAPRILGGILTTRIEGYVASVRLTEVEAYMGVDDPASHAFRGPTRRTRPMFGPSGHIYVYLIYGMHFCVNIVTGPEGTASAVLLRGGDPIDGVDVMRERRGRGDHLTDGPGKLAQALGLTVEHSGAEIDDDLISLAHGNPPTTIDATPRIGITRAVDRRWRFVAAD